VEGRTTLSYDNGEDDTETSDAPMNISNNAGGSLWPAIAAQGDDVYAVWADDTAAAGQSEILFAKSSDGCATFSSTIALSESELFAHKPDIAVSNDNVYIVWEDHNLDEQAAVAFRSSSDGGETFGDTTILATMTARAWTRR
jgi:pterin-4a-carbinolamine dehydratase